MSSNNISWRHSADTSTTGMTAFMTTPLQKLGSAEKEPEIKYIIKQMFPISSRKSSKQETNIKNQGTCNSHSDIHFDYKIQALQDSISKNDKSNYSNKRNTIFKLSKNTAVNIP